MITNRILQVIILLFSFITIPLQIVTTFVLGLLVTITFGLLLIPISLIWTILFIGPLLGLSYVYEKVPFLRILVSIIGIPFAFLGHAFCALMPSMGDTENRVSKLLLCECFPYTWQLYHYSNADPLVQISNGYPSLMKILDKTPYNDQLTWKYVIKLKATNEIESSLNSRN